MLLRSERWGARGSSSRSSRQKRAREACAAAGALGIGRVRIEGFDLRPIESVQRARCDVSGFANAVAMPLALATVSIEECLLVAMIVLIAAPVAVYVINALISVATISRRHRWLSLAVLVVAAIGLMLRHKPWRFMSRAGSTF